MAVYIANNIDIRNIAYVRTSDVTNEKTIEGSYDLTNQLITEHDIATGSFTEYERDLFLFEKTYERKGYGSFRAVIGENESYGYVFDQPLKEQDIEEFLQWYDALPIYDEDKSYVYILKDDTFQKMR